MYTVSKKSDLVAGLEPKKLFISYTVTCLYFSYLIRVQLVDTYIYVYMHCVQLLHSYIWDYNCGTDIILSFNRDFLYRFHCTPVHIILYMCHV